MTGQRLAKVQKAYRIGDPDGDYPIFDATGSRIAPGRWNTPDSPLIYCAEHYSTAMLEKLVHGNGMMPPNQHYIEITLPSGVSYEMADTVRLNGWDSADCRVSRTYGETWRKSGRSLLLFAPSIVARVEWNIMVNPDHPEFQQITFGLHLPVWWDSRLFSGVSGAMPVAGA